MLSKSRIASRFLPLRCSALLRTDSVNCLKNLQVSTQGQRVHNQEVARPRIKNDLSPVNKFTARSHTCGELGIANAGEKVQLCGWMEFQRMGKFIVLRDAYGSTQLIIPNEKKEMIDIVAKLSYESVLCITGRVVPRPEGEENKNMRTGAIEVQVDNLEVLNESMSQLPFAIRKYNTAKESLQMQYRYLALRFSEMQKNLRMRSRVTSKMREYLVDHCGFIDVETPTLFRRTPGGAQEFVVPTQHPGKFYSLVQSPQQFKQLLMIGGVDRYFQIARCYRDEGARWDRQPEFTQLDIEMSFSDREGIVNLVEGLLAHFWPVEELGHIEFPIKRISFEEAYETYGSEQPDLRIPYRIYNVTEDVSFEPETESYAISFPLGQAHLTNSTKEKLDEIRAKNFAGVKLVQTKIVGDSWRKKLSKFLTTNEDLEKNLNLKDGDALFIAIGKKNDARSLIGKIRLEFTNIIEQNNVPVRSKDYKFVWIVDFPLFYLDDREKLSSTHHPFTQPHPDDMQYFVNDPVKVRGLHYDLVLNGSEIAGGSIRVHNADLQKRILDMLRIDKSEMKHLLEALASGAPPHGGIAFGLDRLISIMCNTPSIRSVIAFPKTMEGRDLMSGAPADISEEEKRLYHLKIQDENVQNTKNNKK